MTDGAPRRVGRPSISLERQRQITDAFIQLVGERGLERVTLDDVAVAAGVQRAALRHFVGNREELILAAVDELVSRYETAFRTAVGESPTLDALITMMFSDAWSRDQSEEDAAFDALLAVGVRHPHAHAAIKNAYDVMLDEIAAALRREYPGASNTRIHGTAYVIACLVEQNTTFQQLGYPRARQFAARNAAWRLVGDLAAESGA